MTMNANLATIEDDQMTELTPRDRAWSVVLNAVQRGQTEIRTKDIAERADVSVQTARGVLKSMEAGDWLTRKERGRIWRPARLAPLAND